VTDRDFEQADAAYERDRDLREEDRIATLTQKTQDLELDLNLHLVLFGVTVTLTNDYRGKVSVELHSPHNMGPDETLALVEKAMLDIRAERAARGR
jgi:subtilisin-like proprotein convertase family protein